MFFNSNSSGIIIIAAMANTLKASIKANKVACWIKSLFTIPFAIYVAVIGS